jgi:hypothetical protein
MMPNRQPPCTCTGLFSLITKDCELVFVFRSGNDKQIRLRGHQLPLSNGFREIHARALNKVRFIYVAQGNKMFILVSTKTPGSLERHEYLVKRAIYALADEYDWEVYYD